MKKKRNPLNLSHQTRPRREYIDFDYLEDLSNEDKEWLAQFTDEYYGGKFKFSDKYSEVENKRQNFKKYPDKFKYHKKNLHKTSEQRRECYMRNDAIKRCVFTLSNLSNKLQKDNLEEHINSKIDNQKNTYEDDLIANITLKDMGLLESED